MRVLRYASGLASLSLLAVVIGLLLTSAIVPLAMGWERIVVTSGSMEPGIEAGDVVFADRRIAHPVEAGAVLVFADPNIDGALITHRVEEVLADGGYRTRGDANQTADTEVVAPESVMGRAVGLVPAIGLPTAWLQQGHPERTVAAVLALGLLVWFSRYGLLRRFDPWPTTRMRSAETPDSAGLVPRSATSRRERRRRERRTVTLVRVAQGATLLIIAAAAGLIAPQLSAAAFTSHTSNSGNTFRVPCASRTVLASADTYVDQNSATTPLGTSTELRVMSHAKDQRTLLRFPMSQIPSGCTIVAATLRMYSTSSVAGRTIQAQQVTGSWSEASTTWNNQPSTAGPTASGSSGLGWRELAVTEQTLAMASSGNVDLQLRDSVEEVGTGQLQVYSSREGAEAPQLVLTLN